MEDFKFYYNPKRPVKTAIRALGTLLLYFGIFAVGSAVLYAIFTNLAFFLGMALFFAALFGLALLWAKMMDAIVDWWGDD